MPIALPQLDNRRFDDLVAEAKRLIPTLAPSWTDHNPSDPGIAIIEVFAYVTEMLLYRADQVTDANKATFVRLLRGVQNYQLTQSVDEEMRAAVKRHLVEERAVTETDFQQHANAFSSDKFAPGCVARSVALNLEEGQFQMIVLPRDHDQDTWQVLLGAVQQDLDPRCLLTTHAQVMAPHFVEFSLNLDIGIFPEQDEVELLQRVKDRLGEHFNPWPDTSDSPGWPFGQSIYLSDVYALLDALPGIDFVTTLPGQAAFSAPEAALLLSAQTVIGVELKPGELPALNLGNCHLQMRRQPSLQHEE